MDSRTRLFQDDRPRDLPVELGPFMDAVVTRRRGVHAYLLNWDFHTFFAFDREVLPVIKWELKEHAIRSPGVGNFAVLALLVALIVLAAGGIRNRLGKEESPPKASPGW